MRDYGVVHSTFWTSETTSSLSDDGKLLAFYLMTCPHANALGCFRLSDGYVMDDLGWTKERVLKGFAELFAKGFAKRCGTTFWVVIFKHLYWNRPENPNQVKSVARLAMQVPKNASVVADLKNALCQHVTTENELASCLLSDAIEGLSETVTQTVTQTVSEPSPNQIQIQIQNQIQKQKQQQGPSADAEGPTRSDPIPYQKIVDLYNRAMVQLPKVREITAKRRTAIRTAWNESKDRQSLEFWEAYFAECSFDSFTNGTGPYRNGHENWRPDFDYLVRSATVTKVVERALHREQGAGSAGAQP